MCLVQAKMLPNSARSAFTDKTRSFSSFFVAHNSSHRPFLRTATLMQSKMMRAAWLLLLGARVDGHAIMTKPAPRPGTNTGSGIKLQPFDDARTIANSGCGGRNNNDPGTTTPLQTYQAGATVEVEWKLTIPCANRRSNSQRFTSPACHLLRVHAH